MNECLWEEEEEEASGQQKGEEDDLVSTDDEERGPLVIPGPDDSPEDLEEAEVAARRLAVLQRLRNAAIRAGVPQADFLADQHIGFAKRGFERDRLGHHKANHVTRKHLAEKFQEEHRRIAHKRTLATKARANRVKVAALRRKANARKESLRASKQALKEKLAQLPVEFSAASCALDRGKEGVKTRVACLERLKVRSPPLNEIHELRWTKVRDAFAARKQGSGAEFIIRINKVLEALGTHYKGPTKYNSIAPEGVSSSSSSRQRAPAQQKGKVSPPSASKQGDLKAIQLGGPKTGDPKAFERFFVDMAKNIPQPATVAIM